MTAMSWVFFGRLPPAQAQSAEAAEPRSTVPVTLQSSERGVALTIQPEGDPAHAISCADSCTVTLVPGRYRVGVSKEGESSSRRILIRGAERLILSPPDRGARDLGTGLAISGMVIGGVGSLLTLYGFATAIPCAYAESGDDGRSSGCSKLNRTLLFVGLGGMAAGVAIGVPGLVLAVKNSRPGVEVERQSSARSPSFFVGLGSDGSLTGLSVRATF